MEQKKISSQGKVAEKTQSKIGTWLSLGIVGIVILVTYFVLFGIFMDRI
ncbi:hypothetical protein [Bacillus sp. 2205SS5-2]